MSSYISSPHIYKSTSPMSRVKNTVARWSTLVLCMVTLVLCLVMGVVGTTQKASALGVREIVMCSDFLNPTINGEKQPVGQTALNFATTDLAQYYLVFKSAVYAEAQKASDMVFAPDSLDKNTLDIVNTQNTTANKYTVYDLYGMGGLTWTNYMGEWNYIAVNACQDNSAKDYKLNRFYENRVRPIDTWSSRFDSQDPRVQLTQGRVASAPVTTLSNTIANWIFTVTKTLVAFNNQLVTLSFTNIVARIGIDKVASSIMHNLITTLFMELSTLAVILTAMWFAWQALARRDMRGAIQGLLRMFVAFILGIIMLTAPTMTINLPNNISMLFQAIIMSSLNDSASFASDDLCTTNGSTLNVQGIDTSQVFSNGTINTDKLTQWFDTLGTNASRGLTCQYWKVFAFQPWVLGQYGTDYTHLYATNHAPEGSSALGNTSTWVGNAVVPVGNKQVIMNWAVYQISAQTQEHISSAVADPDSGNIKDKPDPLYTTMAQLTQRNRTIEQVNGDWWRVVDAVSGWDVNEVTGSNSNKSNSTSQAVSSTLDKLTSWASSQADGTHGYSSSSRNGNPNYDSASFIYYALSNAKVSGLPSKPFVGRNMANAIMGVGYSDVTHSNGVDVNNSSTLKAGDILMNANGSSADIYLGNNKVVGAHPNTGVSVRDYDNSRDKYSRVLRLNTSSTTDVSALDNSTAISGTNTETYTKKQGSNPTAYWNTWVGGNALQRQGIALLSLVACLALIGTILLGVSIVASSIVLVLIMAFAPVAVLFGMWQGRGGQIMSSWWKILAGAFYRRIIYSLIYMILLIVTARILSNITGMADYAQSVVLTLLATWAIVANRHRLIDMFTRNFGVQQDGTLNQMVAQMGQAGRNVSRYGQAMVGGAVMGAVASEKPRRDSETIERDENAPDSARVAQANRNRDRAGMDNFTDTGMRRSPVRSFFGGAVKGAKQGLNTQLSMDLYRSEDGRHIMQAVQHAREDKKRKDLEALGYNGAGLENRLNELSNQVVCCDCGRTFTEGSPEIYLLDDGRYVCEEDKFNYPDYMLHK